MRLILGSLTRLYSSRGLVDPDPDVVHMAVLAWRRSLNKELPVVLDWDESPTAPFAELDVGDEFWAGLSSFAPDATKPQLWLPGGHELLFLVETPSQEQLWVSSVSDLAAAIPSATDCPEVPAMHLDDLRTLCRRAEAYRLPLVRLDALRERRTGSTGKRE